MDYDTNSRTVVREFVFLVSLTTVREIINKLNE